MLQTTKITLYFLSALLSVWAFGFVLLMAWNDDKYKWMQFILWICFGGLQYCMGVGLALTLMGGRLALLHLKHTEVQLLQLSNKLKEAK